MVVINCCESEAIESLVIPIDWAYWRARNNAIASAMRGDLTFRDADWWWRAVSSGQFRITHPKPTSLVSCFQAASVKIDTRSRSGRRAAKERCGSGSVCCDFFS
ncbi:hypothetical protein ISN45_At04g009420 [Arabidopsis thaliana x Arabidopsis arenosa]|uniref:Uncharacterized protein n=2 Tax=Arabidopsis TaxID=3701 RepID=A0A178V826_ARATH|nr:hypothetical protein ISN45_At04g009420 [Arabidopsis thaliana x Arabidopsis arenosa]OAP01143.1 hypothetical protein AXX17_AT4G10650 [Arabidopsis thaliana]